jgi:hypothetical protein
MGKTYNNITPDPIFFPDNSRIKAFDDEVSSLVSPTTCFIIITIQVIWMCLASKNQLAS